MTIYLFTNDNHMAWDKIECHKIEFSMDGEKLIIDECDVIKLEDVVCIVSN